jgi:hypothetical protein
MNTDNWDTEQEASMKSISELITEIERDDEI